MLALRLAPYARVVRRVTVAVIHHERPKLGTYRLKKQFAELRGKVGGCGCWRKGQEVVMQILSDGSVYVEKGERFPLKCPACGSYIPFRDTVAVTCEKCGHEDAHEEFCDVEYQMATVQ